MLLKLTNNSKDSLKKASTMLKKLAEQKYTNRNVFQTARTWLGGWRYTQF